MREIFVVFKELWGIGLWLRIILSFVVAILIIDLFIIVYAYGIFPLVIALLAIALFVAMVYWLLNFILKEREERYGNNKKRW
ncbi:hypothetical protein OUHCRE11_47190 [Enterobacter asburiae]